MKQTCYALVCVLALAVGVSAKDAPALSEVDRLKAENFQLRVTVAQLTATVQDRERRLQEIALSAEQARLVDAFRVALKAKPDAVFDWQTLTFQEPKK